MTPLRRLSHLLPLVFLAIAASCSSPDSAGDRSSDAPVSKGGDVLQAVPDTFEFAGVEELRQLFVDAHFTIEDWRAGERSVPRFRLARVPSRWREEVAPHLPVELKKRYFFFVYIPLVLEANEAILLDRERLQALVRKDKERWTTEDQAWLRELTQRYHLADQDGEALEPSILDELQRRVDAVPPSLALAQAAIESGWSTSRFTVLGNALFGQWTWGEDGITPEQQRGGMGDYKIKAFPNPKASIAAYMHNLNTHRSYADFRQQRARRRDDGQELDGLELATSLTSYSEKGEEYVRTVQAVIRVNRLPPVDTTYLRDMRPVVLVPVGPGSN